MNPIIDVNEEAFRIFPIPLRDSSKVFPVVAKMLAKLLKNGFSEREIHDNLEFAMDKALPHMADIHGKITRILSLWREGRLRECCIDVPIVGDSVEGLYAEGIFPSPWKCGILHLNSEGNQEGKNDD